MGTFSPSDTNRNGLSIVKNGDIFHHLTPTAIVCPSSPKISVHAWLYPCHSLLTRELISDVDEQRPLALVHEKWHSVDDDLGIDKRCCQKIERNLIAKWQLGKKGEVSKMEMSKITNCRLILWPNGSILGQKVIRPKICCFVENLAINYFTLSAFHSTDKFRMSSKSWSLGKRVCQNGDVNE